MSKLYGPDKGHETKINHRIMKKIKKADKVLKEKKTRYTAIRGEIYR